MKIRIPKLEDLRLKHLEAITGLKKQGLNAYDKLKLVNKLTGISEEDLRDKNLNDIDTVIGQYFKLFASIDKTNISKEIEVIGKKYKLVDKFSKMPMKWHIDASAFDLKDLSILMAFCYIEKGMEYGTIDKHKNILNPVKTRAAIFREYLPMEHFVKAGFFLQQKAVNYTVAYTEIQKQRKAKDLLSTNGKKVLM